MSVDGLVDFDPLDFLEGMAEESRRPRRGTGNSSRENENEELTSVLSTDVGEDDELEPDRLSVCVEDSAGASSESASAVHPPPEEENGADALLSLTKRLLPEHYDFQIERVLKKTRQCSHVGLQMPDGLLAWAPAIAQILRRFHRTAEAKQRQNKNKKSKASSAASRQSLNVSILGDVNFGACCVDDLTARGLGVELLVHFGHSCLIPTNQSSVRTMYVHVEVDINLDHFVNTVERNFFLSSGENDKTCPAEVSARLTDPGRVAILGTVQFASIIAKAKKELERRVSSSSTNTSSTSRSTSSFQFSDQTQTKPLGKAEVLGCTAPSMPHVKEVIFVCDGRFHLEAVMLRNPQARFYLYNPYSKNFTEEKYDYHLMLELRRRALRQVRDKLFFRACAATEEAAGGSSSSPQTDAEPPDACGEREGEACSDLNSSRSRSSRCSSPSTSSRRVRVDEVETRKVDNVDNGAKRTPVVVGIILGTLGRQGSVAVLERLLDLLDRWNESSVNVPNPMPMTTGSSCRAHDRKTSIEHFTFLLSEISPDSLRQYERDVDFWVQIACPRLSLDWGAAFGKPCLTTYELYHLLAEEEGSDEVLLPSERAAYESAVARKKVHIEKWEAEQVATSSKTKLSTSLYNSSSSSSRPVEECATGPGGGMRAGGGSCTSCGNPGGGCGGEGADRIASLWPEVDYYANQAGPWANYGGGKTSGKKFSHM